MDLIKTIEDDQEIKYESDDSGSDGEAQPMKKKAKKGQNTQNYFDSSFNFVDNQEEYMNDTWNDISKFLKKKAKTTLDDKIAKVKKEMKNKAQDNDEEDDELEDELSDSDLVHDDIRLKAGDVKKKLKRKSKMKNNGESTVNIINGEDNGNENEEKEKLSREFFETPNLSNEDSDSFYSMNISRPLLKAIEAMNFVHPTPIQSAAIPLALAGRDICGCAATGTGKTAAYMLPVLERLLFRQKDTAVTRVLVLVPTRELGVQVYQVSKQLSQFTNIEIGLSVGGLDLKVQEAGLRRNPEIVIATPGRLIDHLKNTPSFGLENIEVLILDEADRMLDECFIEQLKEIIKSCALSRQTLLFSATMTDEVESLAAVSLKKPVKIFVDSNKVVAWNLKQEFVRIRPKMEKNREAILASLICRTFRDHAMVFIRTKKECHRLHILLGLMGVRVGELHGNMSQASRLHALKQFKEEEIDILLTTDVAARGLDIKGVKTVINYQLPNTLEQYIHRVGRTARAGRTGRSVTLTDEPSRKMARAIIRNARDPVKNRIIPENIIDKYIKKVIGLAPEIKRVSEEEQAEREIANLENRANKLENQLKNGPEPERVFMNKKQKTKKKVKKSINFEDDEDKKRYLEASYIQRAAKKAKRPKRILAINENDTKKSKSAPKKRKSAFDNDITNVKRKNVKRLRHVANSAKNEKKRMQNKKGRGGK